MKKIPLTQGKFALVNNKDYARLSKKKWTFDKYAVRRQKLGKYTYRKVYMHREIMGEPEGIVHHKNSCKIDNRRRNLRVGTDADNARGKRLKVPGTSSRFRGVSWDKEGKVWFATLQRDRKTFYCGRFGTEEAAARARDKKAIELFGPGCHLNFAE